MVIGIKFTTALIKKSLVFIMFVGLAHANSATNLAKEIIDLRSEVESLYAELDDEKEGLKSKTKSLVSQKNELEANIRREETRIKQLDESIKKQRDLIAKNSSSSKKLIPLIVESIEILEKEIKSSLPFKTSERLEALENIKTGVKTSQFTPEKALNKLWAFYEDEIRLTKENGIFKQTVIIDNQEKLADIARIGMVAMYFKTADGVYGYVQKQDGNWVYVVTKDKKETEEIAVLFDAFKKQIRTGFFTIPNQLPKTENKQ